MNKTFCVFIISHGRPDKIVTLGTLRRSGYSGLIFIVCDNEDKTLNQYRKNYGDEIILVFDKLHYASLVDSCDNFQNRRTTTHARNTCFDFAKDRNFEYFLVLDDDYTDFRHTFNRSGKFERIKVSKMDDVIAACFRWIETDERILTLCFMQGGDIFGGGKCTNLVRKIFPFQKRKAMNSFFCKTSRRFWFFSRLNEDVNTYLKYGSIGHLFFTIDDIFLQQAQTQATSGGMTDAYLASGTYVKSFYTTMICPSFAEVTMPPSMSRLHHRISWNNAVPKILDEANKKE